ncbi:MAG TPA: nitrile hydratase subunit alpha [Egibacteraceae bacterium]|nr:nitrile hydratase subunit alpha [Egibacteraceae bacterium]
MTGSSEVGAAAGSAGSQLRSDVPEFAVDWEARIFVLSSVLQARGVLTERELREAQERGDGRASAHERLMDALAGLLVERGVIGAAESQRAGAIRPAENAAEAAAQKVRHLESLLEYRGVVRSEEVDAVIDTVLVPAAPPRGFAIVARAWVDEEFRARLLDDAGQALAELGIADLGEQLALRVVENSESVHNVVVCAPDARYPIALLGPSPSWYKSAVQRTRLARQPQAVLSEFGLALASGVEARVWESSPALRYMVLPRRPDGAEGMTEEQLAGIVTRAGLIGAAAV